MFGTREHLVHLPTFHDAPEIHDRDLVRQILDDRQVVGNKQIAQPQLILQAFEQIQHLRLHRYIERAGGLVAHDQFRFDRQRPGNADALALAAGKLMWIALTRVRRQAYLLQQLRHSGLTFRAAGANSLGAHTFLQDLAHQHARIERGVGVLEDDLEVAP